MDRRWRVCKVYVLGREQGGVVLRVVLNLVGSSWSQILFCAGKTTSLACYLTGYPICTRHCRWRLLDKLPSAWGCQCTSPVVPSLPLRSQVKSPDCGFYMFSVLFSWSMLWLACFFDFFPWHLFLEPLKPCGHRWSLLHIPSQKKI